MLAARNDAALRAVVCPWEELDRQAWRHAFDAVFCVGNSLTHAVSASGRRTALAAMAGVLREDGLLVVTSRNWELLRDLRPGLQVADRLTERAGGRGLVVRGWTFPEDWDEPHHLDVAVAVLGDTDPEAVATRSERLTFWPSVTRRSSGIWRPSGSQSSPARSPPTPSATSSRHGAPGELGSDTAGRCRHARLMCLRQVGYGLQR